MKKIAAMLCAFSMLAFASLAYGQANGGPATTTPKIQQSFFGADFVSGYNWPGTDGLGQVATVGGIRLWSDFARWSDINTASGVYNWSNLDNWIAMAQSQNLDVLYTIGDTPQFIGTIPAGSPCGVAGPYSCSAPTDLKTDGTGSDATFIAFMTALVTRYKGEIAYYELWNEADSPQFFSGTMAQMVRMGQDASSIIRSIDPAAKILSPSAHGPTMRTWFDSYVASGGAAYFDIVNAHLRGNGSANAIPETFLTMYADVTTETAKRNLTSLPVWDDEHGIKVGQMTDTDLLAGYTARSVILRAGVGLQRQYIFTWDDAPPYDMQGNDSGTAWDTVAGWLIGHSISACVESGTVYTCAVDNGQIVWDTAQTCSNGTCTTSKYTYSTIYHWQTDIKGKKTALSGKTVLIGYKPIFLTKS